VNKLNKLKEIISGSKSAVIAFSGGVDSTFLLSVASQILTRDKIIAVTANSVTYPKEELALAKKIAGVFKVKHKIIKTRELSDKRFISNPVNRCYFCKKELFSSLKCIADKNGFENIFDASNLSDKKDFRPGTKAKLELGVRSPLQEAGINKEEVRRLSKVLKLNTWDKPSLACLASRIPYGMRVSKKVLRRIEQGEELLRRAGFKQVRLRDYGGLCRIEVPKEDLQCAYAKLNRIVDKLKKLGYNYVTLDLEGYRTGSMNPALPKKVS
jgi:uncharacterized protein